MRALSGRADQPFGGLPWYITVRAHHTKARARLGQAARLEFFFFFSILHLVYLIWYTGST